MAKIDKDRISGVWSATPTPFTNTMEVDTVAVKRMVEHQIRLGIKGLFLCGTCGEGPWMTDEQKRALVRAAAKYARGRLLLAVQASDNSALRILDNIKRLKEDGADIAVIAPPYWLVNPTSENIANVYIEAIRKSPLPVGVYDRGKFSPLYVPNDALKRIYAEKKVMMIKDSSEDPARRKIALAERKRRPHLRLLTGSEFLCVTYLRAGYDGLLLGGAIFNGRLAVTLFEAAKAGNFALAERLETRMSRLMWDVYGGRTNPCWMAGLKHLLVKMKVFRTARKYLGYPLTASCKKAIAAAMKREADILFPKD